MKYMNICKTTLILAEFVYQIFEFRTQQKTEQMLLEETTFYI